MKLDYVGESELTSNTAISSSEQPGGFLIFFVYCLGRQRAFVLLRRVPQPYETGVDVSHEEKESYPSSYPSPS